MNASATMLNTTATANSSDLRSSRRRKVSFVGPLRACMRKMIASMKPLQLAPKKPRDNKAHIAPS